MTAGTAWLKREIEALVREAQGMGMPVTLSETIISPDVRQWALVLHKEEQWNRQSGT